ncbi:MAG: alpha-L-rhamnosidase-related protein, partial [Planctomycetota bacterium]
MFNPFVEVVDGRQNQDLLSAREIDFNDSDWEEPQLLGVPPRGPCGNLLKKECKFMQPVIRKPVKIGTQQYNLLSSSNEVSHFGYYPETPHEIKTIVSEVPTIIEVDFGRSMGGHLQFSLKSCCGGKVCIFYGEDSKKLLNEIIELPEKGDYVFESFDWRGARHVSLQFYNIKETMILDEVSFIEQRYPFAYTADFEASDPVYGDIFRMCRLTAEVATKDHPQDCVGREQALWLSDILIHAKTMSVCFNDLQPVKKAINQVMRIMTDDGVVSVPGPVSQGYHFKDESLPWSEQPLNIPLIMEFLYEATGEI